ncbi:MAG: protein kinase [Deltaproteobacteria bacterium]|nr:protein kinase [Deltaproteobacteria bacterium]
MTQEQNEHDPLLGTVFADRYLLQSRLGKGGMAIVYKASDRNLGREVAIKVLRKDVAGDPVAAKRLIREARAAASLHHPNIITVHDVGEYNGTVYVVMEILSGKPLADVLENDGAIGIERAVAICEQLCAALSVAHSQGIVHRDIKPENLFLIEHGGGDFVKVLDFSIAKLPTEMVTAALTRAGSVFGTPHYMAPEQVEGKSVGPHADLYAVGAVLYELITGDPPFDGPSVIDILLKHVKSPPPTLAAAGIKAPAGLDLLITRLLAKKAPDRPASASVVRDELAKIAVELRHENESHAEHKSQASAHLPPQLPVPAEPAAPIKPPIHFRPPSASMAPMPVQPAVGPAAANVPAAQANTAPTEARPAHNPAAGAPMVGKRVFHSFGADTEDNTVANDIERGPMAEHKMTVRELDEEGQLATAGIPDDLPGDLPSDLPSAPPVRPEAAKPKHHGFGDGDASEGRTLVGVGVGKAVAEMVAKRAAGGPPLSAPPSSAPPSSAPPSSAPPSSGPPSGPPPSSLPPGHAISQVPTVPEVAPLRDRGASHASSGHHSTTAATEQVAPVPPPPNRAGPPRPPSTHAQAHNHTRRPPPRHAHADDRAPTHQGLGLDPVALPEPRQPGLHAAATQAATVIAPVPTPPAAPNDQGKTIKLLWVVAGVSGAIAVALAIWMAIR